MSIFLELFELKKLGQNGGNCWKSIKRKRFQWYTVDRGGRVTRIPPSPLFITRPGVLKWQKLAAPGARRVQWTAAGGSPSFPYCNVPYPVGAGRYYAPTNHLGQVLNCPWRVERSIPSPDSVRGPRIILARACERSGPRALMGPSTERKGRETESLFLVILFSISGSRSRL